MTDTELCLLILSTDHWLQEAVEEFVRNASPEDRAEMVEFFMEMKNECPIIEVI